MIYTQINNSDGCFTVIKKLLDKGYSHLRRSMY